MTKRKKNKFWLFGCTIEFRLYFIVCNKSHFTILSVLGVSKNLKPEFHP